MTTSTWTLVHKKQVYIARNGELMRAEGHFKNKPPLIGWILDVKAYQHDNGKEYVVFKTDGEHQPKAMRLDRFDFRANQLSMLFEYVKSSKQFVDVWNKHIKPNMSMVTGACKIQHQSIETKEHEPEVSATAPCDLSEPSTKRKCTESCMDDAISEKYVGQFSIPVKCLIEPRKSRLIREPNPDYIEALKDEMLNNPTVNVAPIIGVVHLESGAAFNKKHPEAYVYETIGGNHSRIALQSILDSQTDLSKEYRFRTVSVYDSSITDEEAQHLSLRHNRATEFTNKMVTQDKIQLCRKRLYTLHNAPLDSETPDRTTEWRKSCEETLMISKKKLEENLIFFLAGLGKECYGKLDEIFRLYESGKLSKLPKSKRLLLSGRADCAPSNFKGLRGLSPKLIAQLLSDVLSKKLDLKKLNLECRKVKEMKSMKVEFVKQAGLKSWDEALQQYEYYVADERLEEFAGKAFDSKNQPSSEFLAHCRKAIASKATPLNDDDSVVIDNGEVSSKCFIFKLENPVDLNYTMLTASIPGFPGYAIIFATPGEKYAVDDLVRHSRAIKTASDGQSFYVVLSCSPESIGSCIKQFEEEKWSCQTAYWTNKPSSKGTLLNSRVQPLVIAASESVKGTAVQHEDTFSDLMEIALLYSKEEDYVLFMDTSGSPEIVKSLLKKKRNIIVTTRNNISELKALIDC